MIRGIARFWLHGDLRPARPAEATYPTVAKRDPRIDILRGLSLLMIFVDHIPRNLLSKVTLHNFGFADAAEAFVLLAGFSATMAYGRSIEKEGWSKGILRIARRCLRIYVVQIGLVVATMVIVACWTGYFAFSPTLVKPLLDAPLTGLIHALLLMAQPGFLDILPLYVVLLALFPLIYLVMRKSLMLALGLSGGLWLIANLDHAITLPKWNDTDGWYFNPFAWQFLFTIGAVLARLTARNGGSLQPRRWLTSLCIVYLCVAFLESTPWSEWKLPDFRLFEIGPIDKSRLAWPRIVNILAWAYLLLQSDGAPMRTYDGPGVSRFVRRAVELCGRHSLEVFGISCICALFGRLIFRTAGARWDIQIMVNAAGIAAMVLTGLWFERRKRAAKPHPASRQTDGLHDRAAARTMA